MDMARQDRERQHIIAAAQRYHELAWRNDGRRASVVIVPAIVLALVPGWWWAAGVALILATAVTFDVRMDRWLTRALEDGRKSLADALEMRRQLLIRSAVLVAGHSLPYFLLLFAPGAGPAVALLLSMVMMVLLANMHIMTRRMVFMTSALPMLTASVAASMLAPGWVGIALGGLMFVSLIQAATLAGASSDAFNDLIEARLDAENARDALEQRVEERTADLREAVRAAEEANKAKSMFLANMSHELRTPLNAVIGYSEIIEEDLELGDVSECPQHIQRVRGAGKHLLGLISDILDVAKADAERIDLLPEVMDVASLARGVMDTVAPTAAANGTVCDVVIDPGVTTLMVDPLRARQCMLNLASNAAKFTKNGRIILRASAHTWRGEDAIAFEFADTGIGISEDVQKNLFEPFVQADASITRSFGGTGLGLSITRRFARLMGGDVTLQSKLGEGSRFTLILPKIAPSAADDARAAA